MITQLAISGYRSLRDVRLELDQLNVVTGANGSGKSSLYRALRLLAEIAHGGVVRAIAGEGGLDSTLWAGPEKFSRAMKAGEQPVQGLVRKDVVSLKLGFTYEDYGYAIDLGFPIGEPRHLPYATDAQVKSESLWAGQILNPRNEIASRRGPLVKVRDASHSWKNVLTSLSPFDSMMTQASDPREGAEILMVRDSMRNWRFYDHFRTDRDAPVRRPQIGTFTPVLAGDGIDLAAAIRTLSFIGDADAFDDAVEDAFPGSAVEVSSNELIMRQKGLLRPLGVAELSDGTLRYLLLIAALLSPRPPFLMVLNEPEMSLHPDLLAPLGRLIAQASQRSQVIVVSHSDALVAAIAGAATTRRLVLEKVLGETQVSGCDEPGWVWPSR